MCACTPTPTMMVNDGAGREAQLASKDKPSLFAVKDSLLFTERRESDFDFSIPQTSKRNLLAAASEARIDGNTLL